MTRVELRSVICGGSIVTGSASNPITIASFGGAATATDPASTAMSSSTPIPHAPRRDIRASSGKVSETPRILPQGPALGNGRGGR